MKKGKIHLSRKVRNNKVKKKRKTIKRKSTYKRKKNKNKKRSIKQKGGYLEKILAVGAGVVLTGALTGVFANSSFNSLKKHNKKPTKPQTDNVAQSHQHPPTTPYESIQYYKNISIEEIVDFSRLYNTGGVYDHYNDEELRSFIADTKKDYFFLGVWHNFIINFNQFIKNIEQKNHNSVGKYLKNIDKYIISQDLKPEERVKIENEELEVKTLDQLGELDRNRKPDGFIKVYINFIIMSIFLIELNKIDNLGSINIEYSQIFTIRDLQDAIDSIGKESKAPSEFQFTVDKELVEKIFNDSLEIIKEMDDIVKNDKEMTDGDNPNIFNISGNLLDQLLEKRFPGTIGLFDFNKSLHEDIRPTKFYKQMIERNRREMTTN